MAALILLPTALPGRALWAALLACLHLLVVPAATARMLMPADADCEHCHAGSALDDCMSPAEAGNSILGQAPLRTDSIAPLPRFAAEIRWPGANPAEPGCALPGPAWTRALLARHTGDPPVYLRLGQLLI